MKLLLALLVVAGITACGKAKDPQDQVKTKINEFNVGGFGTVMMADFTITNNTKARVKDIEVRCNGYSETGTKIDTNVRTIYKAISPGTSIKVNQFNMGFIGTNVQTTRCSTTSFVQG